ncbi:response regulator transcription factor [Acidipropionibacterium thoenii]|uniref:response regulator transcription factor n=1 Tax=Acidipropionibacterium thoenii TaxID=1751 RepID=UPI000425CC47|nr:response regulator transcription factor [Acidipropionibacterium thoenii]
MSSSTAAQSTVLVVDDEKALAAVVASYLTKAGHRSIKAHTGPEALTLARAEDPDVVILDLGLPGMDGIEVCRRMRTFSDCYILMLTARGDEVDRIVGLTVGADDYLVKPFSNRELVARVQTVLRRPRASRKAVPADIRVFGDLRVDSDGRRVWVAGHEVHLTRTEFDILDALTSRPQMVVSRRQIVDAVWDASWVGDDHVVDVHVANLRKKLGDDSDEPLFIVTVRGVGYRMASR